MYRKFNGRKFKKILFARFKRDAKKEAKNIRKAGYHVRIIKAPKKKNIKSGYNIYIKRK